MKIGDLVEIRTGISSLGVELYAGLITKIRYNNPRPAVEVLTNTGDVFSFDPRDLVVISEHPLPKD